MDTQSFLNPKLEGLILPPSVQNIRRVVNCMGADIFDDFTLVMCHNTHNATFEDNAWNFTDDLYDDQIMVVSRDNDENAYGDGLQLDVFRGRTRPGRGVYTDPYKGTDGAGTLFVGLDKSALQLGVWGSAETGKPALLQREGHRSWVWRDLDSSDDILTLAIEDRDGKHSVQEGSGFHVHYRRGSKTEVGRAVGGCQACLRWKDQDRLMELFREKNRGDICSRIIILSHWLRLPSEQVRQEWLTLEAYRQIVAGESI